MRGISGTPPRKACISGDTRRGFIMPLGSLFLVSIAGLEAAAKVTVRTVRTLAGGGNLRDDDDLANTAVSPAKKEEKIPKEIAIFRGFDFREWGK